MSCDCLLMAKQNPPNGIEKKEDKPSLYIDLSLKIPTYVSVYNLSILYIYIILYSSHIVIFDIDINKLFETPAYSAVHRFGASVTCREAQKTSRRDDRLTFKVITWISMTMDASWVPNLKNPHTSHFECASMTLVFQCRYMGNQCSTAEN